MSFHISEIFDCHLKLVVPIGLDCCYQLTNCKGGETGALEVVSNFKKKIISIYVCFMNF